MLRNFFSDKALKALSFIGTNLISSLLAQGNIVYRQIQYQEFQRMVSTPWRPKYVSIPDLRKTPIPELEGGWCWEGYTPYAYTFSVFGHPVTKKDGGGRKPGEWVTRWRPYGAAQTAVGLIPVFIRRVGECATDHVAEEWVIFADKFKPQADAEAPLDFFPMEPPISPRGLILIIEVTADERWRVKVGDLVNYKGWEGEEDFYLFLMRIGAVRKMQIPGADDAISVTPAIRQIYDVKGRPNACLLELAFRGDGGGWEDPPFYVLLEWD